jgi:Domain of unknown function (DUF4412)
MTRKTSLILLISFLSFPAWAKDLTIKQKVTTGGPSPKTIEAMEYWSGNKVVRDDPRMRTIMDLSAKTVTMVDKARKTYFTQTFDEMRHHAEEMRNEMKKQLENLPPQAKQMMGAMGMKNMMEEGPPVAVKPTGKSEKIAGYETKEYQLEGGNVSGSVWVTDALQPPQGAEEMQAFAKAMGGLPGPGSKLAQAMTEVKGFPLRTTMNIAMGQQKFVSTTEVEQVSEKAPPADVMKIPDGFKKISPPTLQRPSMHPHREAR